MKELCTHSSLTFVPSVNKRNITTRQHIQNRIQQNNKLRYAHKEKPFVLVTKPVQSVVANTIPIIPKDVPVVQDSASTTPESIKPSQSHVVPVALKKQQEKQKVVIEKMGGSITPVMHHVEFVALKQRQYCPKTLAVANAVNQMVASKKQQCESATDVDAIYSIDYWKNEWGL